MLKKPLKPWLDSSRRGLAAGLPGEAGPEGGAGPCVPPGCRAYAVGDIHGRLDLLEELHGLIRLDSDGFAGTKTVVYLGDYIDRGAQSGQVLDLLTAQPLEGFGAIHLLGNHEQAMLDFLENPEAAVAWLSFGGQATLLSYGVGLGKPLMRQGAERLRDEFLEKLPQSHLDFLAACRPLYTLGDYCFVHAGIRPGVPLDGQVAGDLLWIREEFTGSDARHEHLVVHGHSISEEAEWRANRVGIDTGAFFSGLLTALGLQGRQRWLLQTGRGGPAPRAQP